MSIAEKLTTIAENEQKVYEAGKTIDASLTDWGYFLRKVVKKIKYGDTSNGTNFGYMFYGCDFLTYVPLIDTSNGTNFRYMFYACSNLTTIPSIDTSNGTDFSDMFCGCYRLTTAPSIDTSNGTDFSEMFYGCSKLTTVPSIDTSNGTNFRYMFYGCSNLTTILSIDISKGTNLSSMFQSCSKLENITFEGQINERINFQWSTLLTKDSIISIINALSPSSSGLICTLSQAAINNNFTKDERVELFSTKLNWTISLV